MSTIGIKIAERRKALDMTQEDLASRLGYKSKSSINKIELGINDIPQSKIVLFANALSTTVAYLMGWDDDPSPQSSTEEVYEIVSDASEADQKRFAKFVQIANQLTDDQFDQLIEFAYFLLSRGSE